MSGSDEDEDEPYNHLEQGIRCTCGGFMASVEPSAEEEKKYGCGRKGCCSRAFVCCLCKRRIGAAAPSPEYRD